MNEHSQHLAYLNIGSNIKPEVNLPQSITMLREYGRIRAVSTAWESEPVGSRGPNFLNACVLFITHRNFTEFRNEILRPIEKKLGRVRGRDRFAPRTIDIDIVMWDGQPMKLENWNSAFLVVPMAELEPDLEHPITHEKLSRAAEIILAQTRVKSHPEILNLTR